MRAKAETSRAAIRGEALVVFCERGYRATTLEEIGARVGVTRGAVLHHFASKIALLRVVVAPFRTALAGLLDETQVDDPPTVEDQDRVLTALVALFLEHRAALQLLVTDVAARIQLGQLDQSSAPLERLVRLLLGSGTGERNRVGTSAAIGAIVHPLAFLGLEFDSAPSRRELVDAALAVLARPATESFDVTPECSRPARGELAARRLQAAVQS